MTTLTRKQIRKAIAARNKELEPLEVPEWGGRVFVRRLTVDNVEATGFFDGVDRLTAIRRLIVAALVDENHDPVLTDEDVAELAEADIGVVFRVFDKIAGFNNLEGLAEVTPAPSDDLAGPSDDHPEDDPRIAHANRIGAAVVAAVQDEDVTA